MLDGLRLSLALALALVNTTALAATAELPIYGGLGVTLGQAPPSDAFGAELVNVPETALANVDEPALTPGATLPWRFFMGVSLPRPYRKHDATSYVMLNSDKQAMRVVSRIGVQGCGDDFDWLKATLIKKYDVQGDPEITPAPPYDRALHIEFLSKSIHIRCGPRTVIDYFDTALIKSWASQQNKLYAIYQREEAAIKKRRMVMNRRKSIKFADTFTLGDQYRLEGAFGVQFQRPFAKNSTQAFPIDEPFYAVLPNLPTPFDEGDIQLVISPERHPIVIRGTFHNLSFENVADAFKAKYGHPMKASSRHIIHKISGNHAILKKLSDDAVELAFIDTQAQADQRQRLWDKESEGL